MDYNRIINNEQNAHIILRQNQIRDLPYIRQWLEVSNIRIINERQNIQGTYIITIKQRTLPNDPRAR
jgi:hypothetical protein